MMINCKSENCSCVLTDIYTEGKGWIRVCPVCNYAESNPSFHRKPSQFDIQAADAYVKAQRREYAKAEELFRDASQSTDDEGLKTSYLLWAVKCFFGVEYVRETLYEHDDTLRHYQYTPVFARFPFNGSSIDDSLTLHLFSSYLQQHPHLGLSNLYSELISVYRETGEVLQKKEFNYDVFIAWHDRDGSDRCKEFARELSSWLSKKRIYTFTSFDAMEHIPVDHFEPYIYAALATARVFVLVVDDYDSLGKKFLRYEVIRMAIRKTNDPRIKIIFNGMLGHVGHVPSGLMDGWQRHYEDSECTPDRIALVGRDVKDALSSYNKSTPIQPDNNEQRKESLSYESKETEKTNIVEDTTFTITVLSDNSTPSDEQNAVTQNSEYRENQINPSESNAFEGFEYKILEDGNVEITGCPVLTPKIIIPRTIEGRTVTCIGSGAFANCRDIIFYDVSIPDTVIKIGDNAFKDSLLTKISIPSSVSVIGVSAFEHCFLLKSIALPEGITVINAHAFDGCKRLEKIVIPQTVTKIGAEAFSRCSSLKTITLPNSLTTILGGAFSECSSLESISIPESVDQIGICIFEECTSLKEASLPKAWTLVPQGFFVGCSSLPSIKLPDRLEAIEDNAFENCQSLEEIIIPEGTLSIGKTAFSGCKNLRHVYMPDSVTSIEGDAFSNCNRKLTIWGKETAYSKSFAKKHKLKYSFSNGSNIHGRKPISIWVPISICIVVAIICCLLLFIYDYIQSNESDTDTLNLVSQPSPTLASPDLLGALTVSASEEESVSALSSDNISVENNHDNQTKQGTVAAFTDFSISESDNTQAEQDNQDISIHSPSYLDEFNGHSYALFDCYDYTWMEANDYCELLGGHLVCIADSEEQNHIVAMLKYGGNKKMYWIGGKRSESGLYFEWLDGQQIENDSPYWDVGQPDNSDINNEGRHEDYMQILKEPNPDAGQDKNGYYYSKAYRWNDNVNENTYGSSTFFTIANVGFICEWEFEITHYEYRLYEDTAMTWAEARDYCRTQGGELACIDTISKQNKIEDIITVGQKGMYWIGGYKTADGKFVWLNGKPVDGGYENWDYKAPDNWLNNEGYMQIYREGNPKVKSSSAFTWNDAPIDNVIPNEDFFSQDNVGFICEFRSDPWGWQ